MKRLRVWATPLEILWSDADFEKCHWAFSGSTVVRIQHFHCRGWCSLPGQGTKTL